MLCEREVSLGKSILASSRRNAEGDWRFLEQLFPSDGTHCQCLFSFVISSVDL